MDARPDIVITIRGGTGSGKSCLMGDLAEMLAFLGSEVRCFRSGRYGERRCDPPAWGNFEKPRRVKIVEVEG
jgi:hypothetical protein